MTERKAATKAIILARVSSKEQEDGYLIDAQVYRLEEYALRKGLKVLQTFKFSESSTVGSREKFLEAINFAKQQKEITAVVTDKVDRLQRSYKETPLLNSLIEKEKIELHFYTENCIIHKYSTSQEKMMWNMFVMMAQSYVDSLRDNVNRSIAQKLRLGEWISAAPIGYLHIKNGKNERGKGSIMVDPDRSPIIKKIFEIYSTGNYSATELLRKTKEWGLRNSRGNQGYLCKSHIYKILENPFYCGVMRVERTGKHYPHIYPPIICKELFERCQEIRTNRKKRPSKYRGKEYIFRGLIECANTGRIVTADTKYRNYLNGNNASWTYLRSWDQKNPNRAISVMEDKILEEVESVFGSMYLEPKLLSDVINYIKSTADVEQDFHKRRIGELHSEHTKIITRMDRLTDLFLDGELDKKTHEEKREQLVHRREELMQEIESHNKGRRQFYKNPCKLNRISL